MFARRSCDVADDLGHLKANYKKKIDEILTTKLYSSLHAKLCPESIQIQHSYSGFFVNVVITKYDRLF